MTELEEALRDKQVAQELLLMVLNEIGEPVVVDLPGARIAIGGDNAIDVSIDEDRDVCILQVVPLSEQ